MVTTRRSSNNVNSVFESYATPTSDVAILERPIEEELVTKVENVQQPAIKDLNEEAKERRKNLDRILNYDRYSEQMSAVVETLAPVIEEQKEEAPVIALSDEDIRPTSTTMQFGEDIESIREEMKMEREEEKTDYRLNGKGKIAVVLYSLVITVILALIVMNTGMLSRLNEINAAKTAELSMAMSKYSAVMEEINAISDSSYIANVAENNYGMVKGN